ncbi:alanyl-tRNA editing protein [Rhodoligotrophos defluvii]|uniref:alanyl-tRNA editing protein n=1 Tax=Rhodoligotrophos defluvii TaxID=2561934 RepID=UPI0010CA11C7|nr:alanyl-tRNA editing protein [Rhodoligotrophos defluvii]
MTEMVFRTDPYAREIEARVLGVNERGGLKLDRTNFYAMGGGQPGDRGVIEIEGLGPVEIATTVYDDDKTIVHVPASPLGEVPAGAAVRAMVDWSTRYRHMRAHTCLHLLCALVPFPVTGGQIATDGGRLDFDIPEAGIAEKEQLTERLMELVAADHPVAERWISDEELMANPQLVRTMAVKPPMGAGRVRLVAVGDIDLQPCGGTHVRSTAEIGRVAVSKIEKKGRQNRRIRISFVEESP